MKAILPILLGLLVTLGALSAPEVATAQAEDGANVSSDVGSSTPADAAADRVKSIRRNEYFYQSYGRRDLFSALVTGEFQPLGNSEIVDVNAAKLVGVMWGPTDRFALVEDGEENGFILRVGDRVQNGRVVAIQENSLVATISLYGITSRVILRLEDRKEKR